MTNYAVVRYETKALTHTAAEAIATSDTFLMKLYRENCVVKGLIVTPDPRKAA